MRPPSNPKLPPPAEPRYSRNFDPWHSVATGHQRAETRGPQGWRESRNLKMNSQFRAGNSGGQRISDTVGVGSADFDERLRMLVPKEVRARAMNSVVDMLRNPGSMRAASRPPSSSSASASRTGVPPGKGLENEGGDTRNLGGTTAEERLALALKAEDEAREEEKAMRAQERRIFGGVVVYINGSTHPLVSDHKLKHLLSEHGARMSPHLGRRQLEKEIRRIGGCGIKFVGVEWVLESIKAGKRLPEARFANLKIAARAQQSVLGAFSKADGSAQQPAVATPRS
ncbi:hypothetical protein C8A03DRAFT_12112 [Achaetomium macrosporum]|uniref:BRCT domain-containing protein n=1 Tax=Achaetomium macrosporum TaxID=79813 RepID=A0AAN7CIB5_9PEZI|nr:hypothetical protein C8A03DRAFT_12112 [Achaetomium macrosporum]